jgi:hypothetical protein
VKDRLQRARFGFVPQNETIAPNSHAPAEKKTTELRR